MANSKRTKTPFMNTTSNAKSTGLFSSLGSILGICILLFVALYYLRTDFKYLGMNEAALGRYLTIKWWLIGHLAGGALALLIGPFQFWTQFRNRYLKTHRILGKIYLIAIVIGSICATLLAWTSAVAIHWTWAFSLQILGLVWISTALMAYRTIRLKRIQQHKEWMIRSYIVTLGFVAFRFLNNAPFYESLGSFVERAPTVIWMVWALPLFFVEFIFQWNKK